jgi:hypothetical protein
MSMLRDVWHHPALAAGAFALSIVLFAAGVIAGPLVIARLPADYFVREEREPKSRSLPRSVLRGLRNVLGFLLILAGVAMLVLPGQGVLAILVGVSLVSFPGKRKLQRRLLGIKGVRRVVAAIRKRAGQPPLQLDLQH